MLFQLNNVFNQCADMSVMIRCAKEVTFRYDIDSVDASEQDLLDLETTKVTEGTNRILFFNVFKV